MFILSKQEKNHSVKNMDFKKNEDHLSENSPG